MCLFYHIFKFYTSTVSPLSKARMHLATLCSRWIAPALNLSKANPPDGRITIPLEHDSFNRWCLRLNQCLPISPGEVCTEGCRLFQQSPQLSSYLG